MGIDGNNVDALIANLTAQGISDIASINKFSDLDARAESNGGPKLANDGAAGTKARSYHDTGGSKKRVQGGVSSLNLTDAGPMAPIVNALRKRVAQTSAGVATAKAGSSRKRVEGSGQSTVDISGLRPEVPVKYSVRKKVAPAMNPTKPQSDTGSSKKRIEGSGLSSVDLAGSGPAGPAANPMRKKVVAAAPPSSRPQSDTGGTKKRVEGGRSSVDLSGAGPQGPSANPLRKKAVGGAGKSSMSFGEGEIVLEGSSVHTAKKMSTSGEWEDMLVMECRGGDIDISVWMYMMVAFLLVSS